MSGRDRPDATAADPFAGGTDAAEPSAAAGGAATEPSAAAAPVAQLSAAPPAGGSAAGATTDRGRSARDDDAEAGAPAVPTFAQLAVYFAVGLLFGIVLIKSEVVSWFRIQEMFRFQAFHMYGVMGSALLVAGPAVAMIERRGLHSATGEPIRIPPKAWGGGTRYVAGGLLFGVGWALVGACPGPMFALIGAGAEVVALALLGALAGAWTYGLLRPRLPH